MLLLAATFIRRTTAGWRAALQGTLNNGAGAAHAGINGHRSERAIALAGAAFHAGIAVNDAGFAIFQDKNSMWTDGKTHAATIAA
jgi:hypothetical protein